jgi:hypothetical protein
MVERQVQMQHFPQRDELHGLGIVPPLQPTDVIHFASENGTGLTNGKRGVMNGVNKKCQGLVITRFAALIINNRGRGVKGGGLPCASVCP